MRLEHLGIPVQIQFRDAVVGQRQLARARILVEIEIHALDDDQGGAVTLDDRDREGQRRRLLDGLVARNDAAAAVHEDRSPGTVCGE